MRFFRVLFAIVLFTTIISAVGGPDDYGYYWVDDLDSTGLFDWIEPDTTNVIVFPGTDDEYSTAPLPFPVKFYGITYTVEVYVSTNCALGFDDRSIDAYSNQPIPTGSMPNSALFPYWDDMSMIDSISHAYYQTEDTAPNRKFIVTWSNWFFLGEYGDPEDPLTFQVIIYENATGRDNEIKFQYFDPYGGEIFDANGVGATIGIESEDGIDGLEYSYNVASLDSGRAILFNKPFFMGHDCALNSIISPSGSHVIGDSIEVAAVVSNRGTLDESSVPVTMVIVDSTSDTVYNETAITALTVGEMDTIEFIDWMPTEGGEFNVYCEVSVASDSITINDSRSTSTTVWSHISSGGPDSAGYRWFDSFDPSGPIYVAPPFDSAIDVPELFGDDEYTQIELPFTFNFYGEDFDSIWVSTNGWAAFGADPLSAYYSNDSIPDVGGPDGGMLAIFWDDCDVDTAFDATASIKTYDTGASFWIIWYNIYCPYTFSDPTGQVTFGIHLFSNGIIEYHYLDMHTPEAPLHDYGGQATVGMENPGETDGLLYEYNGFPPGNPLFDNFAIRFLPPSAGPDTVGPSIAHAGVTENYSEPPDFCLHLTAQISDYNAVAAGSLYIEGGIALAPESVTGSNYSFSLCGVYPGDTVWYHFTACDTLGNCSESMEYYTIIQNPHNGGPDMIDYKFVDSWATWDTMAPAYNWFEINPDSGGPGMHLDISTEIVSDPIIVGGAFPFYADVANSFVICKNGWISTDTTASAGDPYPEDPFPDPASPNAIIAPLWTYLVYGSNGSISYFEDHSAQLFYVQWEMFDSTGTDELLQFQTVIDLSGDGSWIIFYYKNVDGYNRDFSAAIIEDQYGVDGLSYFYMDDPSGSYVPKNSTAVLFYNPTLYGIDEKPELPEELSISAYPNPFNNAVSIDVRGAEASSRLDIFDISGRVVNSFDLEGGKNRIIWQGDNQTGEGLSSGIYFARLISGEKILKERLLLLK
ncbi:T9SS type A sorting domain-containing protein [bacterium]|nr:T9SS type A sorting domain-containing protein [bacterium]